MHPTPAPHSRRQSWRYASYVLSYIKVRGQNDPDTPKLGIRTISAAEQQLAIEMSREEEEVVHIGLPGFAATIGQQRVGILHRLGIEEIHRDDFVIGEEIAA